MNFRVRPFAGGEADVGILFIQNIFLKNKTNSNKQTKKKHYKTPSCDLFLQIWKYSTIPMLFQS